MATEILAIPNFAVISEAAQTAVAIANNEAPGHKMLAKLRVGLERIQAEWARVAAAAGAGAAATGVTALAAMDKFIIVEKYPGGSRRRRQSKKRKNQRNHNNNQ
jgi:hypothetical protein